MIKFRTTKGEAGSVATMVVVILSAIMAMTMSSVFVYLVNRAKWQAKIREANKLTYVLEGLAKYTKEAYDRGAAICAAAGGLCPANCPAPSVRFCSGGTCGAVGTKLLCFAPRAGATVSTTCPAGSQLGIMYMNEEYCMVNGLMGPDTEQIMAEIKMPKDYQMDPTIEERFVFAAPKPAVNFNQIFDGPLHNFASPATAVAAWSKRLDQFYGDLAQPTASKVIADFQSGERNFIPEKFPFNLIGKVYATGETQLYGAVNDFVNVSPGTACTANNAVNTRCGAPRDLAATPGYLTSVGGQCTTATQQYCQRSCSAAKKCMNLAVCPSFATSSACVAGASSESMGLNVLINFN